MKIVCYCQHVLGIGHFHRSLELCKALAQHHETVMVLGGPDVDLPKSAVTLQSPVSGGEELSVDCFLSFAYIFHTIQKALV